MAVKSPVVSTLNPNAPLFVPAAFVATEDFSAEWWRLVETCPAFRDYWLAERFVGGEEADLGVDQVLGDELDELDAEAEEFMIAQEQEELVEQDNSVYDGGDNKENQELICKGIKAVELKDVKDPPPEKSSELS